MTDSRPRHTQIALPPYSYVPGHHPHPVSDPDGHMHGQSHPAAEPLQPTAWRDSKEYLFGIDLFNHGFYWEAHEAWESLWHAAGRKGAIADFLKGLIKLAAAVVKAREGNPRGVQRHAARAKELLSEERTSNFCGLNTRDLLTMADALQQSAASFDRPQSELLLDYLIEPSEA